MWLDSARQAYLTVAVQNVRAQVELEKKMGK
jgi:hypothetical protein